MKFTIKHIIAFTNKKLKANWIIIKALTSSNNK